MAFTQNLETLAQEIGPKKLTRTFDAVSGQLSICIKAYCIAVAHYELQPWQTVLWKADLNIVSWEQVHSNLKKCGLKGNIF